MTNKKKYKECMQCGGPIRLRQRVCAECMREYNRARREEVDREMRGYRAVRVELDNPRSAYGDY